MWLCCLIKAGTRACWWQPTARARGVVRGVDPATVDDADRAAAVGAPWADFIPRVADWATVDGPTAQRFHAQQLRLMLASLSDAGGGQVR